MRKLLLPLLCSGLGACMERAPSSPPPADPGFPSFAIRNEEDLDSLFRLPSVPPPLGSSWGEEVPGDTTDRSVVLGWTRVGNGHAHLILKEGPTATYPPQARIILAGTSGPGRVLATYAMSKERQEICSVEWRPPTLIVRGQAHWITEQDSVFKVHVAQRTTRTELRITDRVQVVRQDTAMTVRDIREEELFGAMEQD